LDLVRVVQIVRLVVEPSYTAFIVTYCVDVLLTTLSTLLLELGPTVTESAASVEQEELQAVTTTIKEIRYETDHFVRITAEDVIMYFKHDNPDIVQQDIQELLCLEKEEMFYNRYREDANVDKVVYINKTVVEECVNFSSTTECKLYLAQMTGSSDSLAEILRCSIEGDQVEEGKDCPRLLEDKDLEESEESEESNGFVVLPRIIYTDENTPLDTRTLRLSKSSLQFCLPANLIPIVNDSSCECDHLPAPKVRRRCRSAEPVLLEQEQDQSKSVSAEDITVYNEGRRRSLPTEEMFNNQCTGCRTTSL